MGWSDISAVREILQSPARNRFLRRAARVEYRCQRGCFLGAVFAYEGEEYIYWRQWTRVQDVYVGVDELGGFHGRYMSDEGREKVEEVIRYESGYGILGSGVELRPSKIKEAGGLDDVGAGSADYCDMWPVGDSATSDEGTLNFNCGHSELVIKPDHIGKDIQRLRRSAKKTVYA